MSWLSNYFSREKLIAELRNENERLHGELRETNRCLEVINGNLLIIGQVIHDSTEGDEDGALLEYDITREEQDD